MLNFADKQIRKRRKRCEGEQQMNRARKILILKLYNVFRKSTLNIKSVNHLLTSYTEPVKLMHGPLVM